MTDSSATSRGAQDPGIARMILRLAVGTDAFITPLTQIIDSTRWSECSWPPSPGSRCAI
ncbi:hypothetical protein GGQ68_001604 [Sagittula marina]|uniref:Uncharacterized protein n=1 Tax=Sagittula marina TaxID=943940 RepID=A0A7W6DRA9_9RHOB|nr:hypothetical protein [Sagittula marina]MBB3985275.1 hypothetical protein [Sagittula marina]